MRYPFRYDQKTAVEALLYIAERLDDPTLHRVFKVMYFADKKHLEQYGRLIFGDCYIAMKKGPVPSRIYTLAKIVRGDFDDEYGAGVANTRKDFVIENGHHVVAKRPADLRQLSDSEREVLDWAIREYSELSFDDLVARSQNASYEAADEDDVISVEALTIGVSDRDALLEHLGDPHP